MLWSKKFIFAVSKIAGLQFCYRTTQSKIRIVTYLWFQSYNERAVLCNAKSPKFYLLPLEVIVFTLLTEGHSFLILYILFVCAIFFAITMWCFLEIDTFLCLDVLGKQIYLLIDDFFLSLVHVISIIQHISLCSRCIFCTCFSRNILFCDCLFFTDWKITRKFLQW